MDEELESALLAAHSQRDLQALTTLYMDAADNTPDLDEACFFLTQAYVFALDTGDKRATQLHKRLIELGREE